jgi:hypothetical protein
MFAISGYFSEQYPLINPRRLATFKSFLVWIIPLMSMTIFWCCFKKYHNFFFFQLAFALPVMELLQEHEVLSKRGRAPVVSWLKSLKQMINKGFVITSCVFSCTRFLLWYQPENLQNRSVIITMVSNHHYHYYHHCIAIISCTIPLGQWWIWSLKNRSCSLLYLWRNSLCTTRY